MSALTDLVRRLKPAYLAYNLFQRERLQHNVPLYRKLGMRKQYFSPVSSADFSGVDVSALTEGKTYDVRQTALYKDLDEASQQSLRTFEDTGYALLQGYLDDQQVERINAEIDRLMQTGDLNYRYVNKLMFAIRQSDYLNGLWTDPRLLEVLNHLIRGEARLFQSINFLTGSQQKTHSDSIHMTTFPLGGLLGLWVALEDITADSGPLHYYTGSHRLPYYLNADYDNAGNWLLTGDRGYGAYEEMIARKIEQTPLKKEVFLAKRGDLFIWHANLLHGGEPRHNEQATRKSMVLHYFDARRICYHEITQRPALLDI